MRARLQAAAGIGKQVMKNRLFIVIAEPQFIHGTAAAQKIRAAMSDQNYEAGSMGQLTTDLQKSALDLIKHLGTNNFRIRIDGTVPAVYITLGEGRSCYSADSADPHAPKKKAIGVAKDSAHDGAQVASKEGAQQKALLAGISKLRKMLAPETEKH